jgi:hypothetical protein
MAKQKKSAKKNGGPFIATAVLCQGISEDSDGVLSVHRIVDEIRIVIPHDTPTDFPSQSKPVEVQFFALIIIRRGNAPAGKHKVRLVIEQPNGKATEAAKVDVEMPKYPNGAVNVKTRVSLKLYSQGVFWIDVILGKQRLTRMALNLLIQRQEKTETK